MTKNFNTNTDNKEEWLTPLEIIHSLGAFDLDPCAPPTNRRPWEIAKIHYSKEEHGDGLSMEWKGRVWLNPPYGKETFKWLEKLSTHASGIAIIFARTETVGFHKQIWNKAHSVYFFKGRLSFREAVTGNKGNTANAPSCLVSYSQADTLAILQAHHSGKIKGKLIYCTIPNEENKKMTKIKYTLRDSRGRLWVACSECEYGCGRKVEMLKRLGCFRGKLLTKELDR